MKNYADQEPEWQCGKLRVYDVRVALVLAAYLVLTPVAALVVWGLS